MCGEESDWKDLTSGVPQGSVLNPLLFVLFINDLSDVVKHDSEVFLYADATKVFRKIQEVEDCDKLQEDLNELREWTEKRLLGFHPEKSKYMRFGNTAVDDYVCTMHNDISNNRTESHRKGHRRQTHFHGPSDREDKQRQQDNGIYKEIF